jgi:hypothetical protein
MEKVYVVFVVTSAEGRSEVAGVFHTIDEARGARLLFEASTFVREYTVGALQDDVIEKYGYKVKR